MLADIRFQFLLTLVVWKRSNWVPILFVMNTHCHMNRYDQSTTLIEYHEPYIHITRIGFGGVNFESDMTQFVGL